MSGVFRNIDTPPPHRPVRWVERGWGSIVRKTPDTALYSIYVSTLCRQWTVGRGEGGGSQGYLYGGLSPRDDGLEAGDYHKAEEGLAVNRLLCRTQVHGATWGLCWNFKTIYGG
jgi:hypothetical protein